MNKIKSKNKKEQVDSTTVTRVVSGAAIIILSYSLYLIMSNSTVLFTGFNGYLFVLLYISILLLYVFSLVTGELFADYVINKRKQ
ncbi:hypothetical protein [Sinobaca sp. H24]|uniref:hypothetical protein n=1 Tax=Sinobaca sp. H24 TaxID=2923376 RepID=UPI002079DAD3|nr:hypothetical protein [Sinobaca sp. H24]